MTTVNSFPLTTVAASTILPPVQWTYSSKITDADPGDGKFRLNNATPASATAAYIDNEEIGGTDVSAWLDTFDDGGASTKRGTLTITSTDDTSIFYIFNVTGSVVDGTGYRKLTIAYIAGGGVLTDGHVFTVAFTPRTATIGTDVVGTADTDVSGYSFVLDEDTMASDSATKVPTQQSVKAYVDTVSFAETTDGQAATIPSDRDRVFVNGVVYSRAASEPSHVGKFQSTDGAWWEIAAAVVTSDMYTASTEDEHGAIATHVVGYGGVIYLGDTGTITIPTQFATLQLAMDACQRIKVPIGETIFVNIATGTTLTAGCEIKRADLSHVIVTSDDATVLCSLATGEDLFTVSNSSKSPEIRALFNMQDTGQHGLNVTGMSRGVIAAGGDPPYDPANALYGIINAGNRAVDAGVLSDITAENTNLSGAGEYCAGARSGSRVNVRGSNLSGCGDIAVLSTMGAIINAQEADITDATTMALEVLFGGIINATDAVTDSGSPGASEANVPFNKATPDGLILANDAYDEEGTWTPVLAGATTAGTYTYTTQKGFHKKIGTWVQSTVELSVATVTSAGSGDSEIHGLTFTPANHSAAVLGTMLNVNVVPTNFAGWVLQVTTGGVIRIRYLDSTTGAATNIAITDLVKAGTQIIVQATYQTS